MSLFVVVRGAIRPLVGKDRSGCSCSSVAERRSCQWNARSNGRQVRLVRIDRFPCHPSSLKRNIHHTPNCCRKRSRNASDGENRWDRIRAKFKLMLHKMRRDTHFLQVTGRE